MMEKGGNRVDVSVYVIFKLHQEGWYEISRYPRRKDVSGRRNSTDTRMVGGNHCLYGELVVR